MSKIVRATAGAGKTTGLLEAVYDVYKTFYAKEGLWPKVLLSTFTVKAANELSERLISKAVDLNDEQFLDYVSSNFLEVGTLHSVFLKILDQISGEDGIKEARYFSHTHRNKVGRAILHDLIKEKKIERFFIESKDESDLLKTFAHIYESSNVVPSVMTKDKLNLGIRDEFALLAVEASEAMEDDKFRNIFETSQSFSEMLLYISSLDKKDQKKCKDLKKFIESDVNDPEFVDKYSEKHELFGKIYEEWSARLREYTVENQVGSISDAEVQVLNKLTEKKFSQKVWDFCFFDEYQDTSPMQKKIIDIVAAQSNNYFVGDPFQSIYFFRGARKEIFLKEFDEIKSANGETEYRLNNYRSAPEIVDFANGLTKFMLPDFMEMEPFVKGVSGEVKVVHFLKGSEIDEFTYVKDEIKKIDLTKESVAILARGSKSLLSCGKELRRAGIIHKFSLSKGFSSSLEVIELVGFLNFLLDPDNDENLLILLMSYWVKVSDYDLQKSVSLVDEGEYSSIWQSLHAHEGLASLRVLLAAAESLPLSSILSDFVGVVGFLDFTEGLDLTKDRESNILKLIGALESEEAKMGFNPLGFCDDILSGSYRFESEEVKSDKGCLLMTVHGSKGLQFDHVFLIGMNKSNAVKSKAYYFDLEQNMFSLKERARSDGKMKFPLAVEELVSNEKLEVLSESKRLFYVAMTRAKKSLFLIGSKKIPKTSIAPSWLNMTIDFLGKTEQEGLYTELEPYGISLEGAERGSIEGGFLLRTLGSEFLEKSSLAVTQAVDGAVKKQAESKEYDTDVHKLSKLTFSIAEGVLFHEMMERVTSLEETLIEVPACFPSDYEKHKDAARYLFEQKDFPFEEILVSGSKEWGFDFSGSKRVSGKIDLWSKVGDKVWLVDYKTGGISGAEKGFGQLEAYKTMLEKYLQKVFKEEKLVYNLVLTFPYDKKTFVRLNT